MALESPDDGFGNISVPKPALSYWEMLVCKDSVPQHQTRAPHKSLSLVFSSPWQRCWGWEVPLPLGSDWGEMVRFKSSSQSNDERNDILDLSRMDALDLSRMSA